jgi:endoglucanase Acf2
MKTIAALVSCSILLPALCASARADGDPRPVPVGAGSYAEFPPANREARTNEKLAETLNKQLYIDPSKAGVAVPTNQWWTDLIIRQYCGNLWAHPMTVSADADGVKIFHPTSWTPDGRDMVLDNPIQIKGELQQVIKPVSTNIVIADFEGDTYGPGWTTEGEAFGTGPAHGIINGQSQVIGFEGKGLANSYSPNDSGTGTLISPPVKIERNYIHFLLAGGNDPEKLGLRLMIDGKLARTATGDNSGRLKWKSWDVSELKGESGQIVIEDKATGGWGHVLVDQITESDSASPPEPDTGNRFAPKDARALNWGDWTVQFRLQQSASQTMDVTVGHGLPFVWVECKGVTPIIASGEGAAVTDERGSAVSLPATGDELCIEYGGRYYGVYAPDNTRFTQTPDGIRAAFQGGGSYLVIAALPSTQMLRKFHDYAYAIPRGSIVDWNYDPAQGEVITTWNLKTEALKGANLDSIQGWIPHHYREGSPQFAFDGIEYQCARGLMKCAEGHQFVIRFPFNGLLPNLPRPQVGGYDEARMKNYITEAAAKTTYGGDTYWGGKDILCDGRYLAMAEEMGCPEADTLKKTLSAAMADWFTYTPGEKEHYFARYPRWKALVGFRDSYGSGEFNDQHFHYGYFTTATALLGMYDPQFLKDYGPMARLVAKEYANWDRQDPDFPFLRTFDLWEGHSWAGGYSSPGGNNQESSSEAVQSWGGLFLLGAVMADKDMTAAGAMGYAMETAAAREYWFDYHGHMEGPKAAVFPPEYRWKTTGIFFAAGRAFGTYFSGDPGWVYGIHWLPASPFLTYLAIDPKFSKLQWDNMWADRQASIDKENARGRGAPKENTLAAMGNLATVMLGYELQFDPDSAAKQMDDLWAAKNPAMTTDPMDGIVYYLAHANRMLGSIMWQYHTSIPTSCVYYNASTKTAHFVIYNPLDSDQMATVYAKGIAVGRVMAPAKTLLDAATLDKP